MRFIILAALLCTMALATVGGFAVTQTSSATDTPTADRLELPVSTSPSPTPTSSTAKYKATAKVVKKKGVSYLDVAITYGGAARFTVKQKVCKGKSCRTASASLPVTTGAGKTSTKLGKGSYKASGKPSVSLKVLPWPTRTITATATPSATTTVTASAAPSATVTVAATTTVSATATVTATVTATATITATATTTVTTGPTVTVTATPTTTTTGTPDPNGCGAPSNPYNLHYCQDRGEQVWDPPTDVCSYFRCIDAFDEGTGFMVVCNDGMVSMSGGVQGNCSQHTGQKAEVREDLSDGEGLVPTPTPTPTPSLTPTPTPTP
ncbi:hypothetical protein [Nonomuraea dietziae]|uniref:hypothetical protein n=1 Tax=Nonomuraea dietziae TaxID=65515 RepID=UPI003401C703